jgi:hypothetical protein
VAPRALLATAAALALAAAANAAPAPRLDPQHLPSLPAQGVVVERPHDVLLVGSDGQAIGKLAGFAGPYTGRTYVLEALAEADPSTIFLAGPGHRVYALDPARSRLLRLGRMHVALAGGAFLNAHAVPQKKPFLPKVFFSVTRGTKVLVRSNDVLRVVGGRLVVAGGTVLDTVSGRRWPIGTEDRANPGGCEPAGLAGTSLVAVCAAGKFPILSVRVYTVSGDGTRRPTGPVMRWGFGALSALLSPDGRYVGATLAVGCGPPVGAITPVAGGRAGFIANGRPVGAHGAVDSEALGWTPDGKLLARILYPPSDCEHSPPSGVYAVDPATFAKHLVAAVPQSESVWMWGAGLSAG